MISWIYFFSLKRSKTLKLKKSEEILGFDALENARAKGIMIEDLLQSIHKRYPESKRKGC